MQAEKPYDMPDCKVYNDVSFHAFCCLGLTSGWLSSARGFLNIRPQHKRHNTSSQDEEIFRN